MSEGPLGQGEGISFPDLPRLELDQLLHQLVDRAEEVMTAQGRLRGLLRANQLITGRLSLADVLRGVVEAAMELVGARYAALGVLAPGGGLAEFIHAGMPADAVERIGHLPEGRGLLGAIIDDPRPIRLQRMEEDPRSSGFPAGHPEMHSFLGVPIRIRNEVFGNLYLSESTTGSFSPEDEELTRALAATAAVAIENARLYEASRARGEWMLASTAIMRRLLSEPEVDQAHPLELIAEYSQVTADADLVTVVRLPDEAGMLHVDVAAGPEAGRLLGKVVPAAGSLAGEVLRTGEAVRLSLPEASPERPLTLGGLDVGPLIVVPLLGTEDVLGVMTVARREGRQAFTAEDLAMAAGFANQAAIAIELAEARNEEQQLAMMAERERIAAALGSYLTEQLATSESTLAEAAADLPDGPARDRVSRVAADIGLTLTRVRDTIHALSSADVPSPRVGPEVATRLTPG